MNAQARAIACEELPVSTYCAVARLHYGGARRLGLSLASFGLSTQSGVPFLFGSGGGRGGTRDG